MKSFRDLFEEVYFFSGYELIPKKECVTTTNVPTTSGTTTRTTVLTATSTKLITSDPVTREILKYSTETHSDETKDFESDSYADAKKFTDEETVTPTEITKRTPPSCTPQSSHTRKCNGPPCLTPYVTTVRGETRDFLRILKDLNHNHLDSHSSDFLTRK